MSNNQPDRLSIIVRAQIYHFICHSDMERKPRVWIMKPPNWFCGIGITLISSKGKPRAVEA